MNSHSSNISASGLCTEEELEERGRKERDPTIKERLLAILHEMIKSCEGVALDLFGERKEGY